MAAKGFLTIEGDRFTLTFDDEQGVIHTFATVETFDRIMADRQGVPVYASSSLDFPQESTSDPDIIRAARTLRGRA